MAGYEDTRKKIIETLMGRPIGEEIQPENHQDYALNMLNYIRSLELIANGPLIGIATPTTQPVQPNDARACYLAGVAQDRTVTFQNFRNYLGQPIQITNGEMEACLVILIWDTQYWSAETVPTSIISQAENATFYYRYNIRKTYTSIANMNADRTNPIGTDGARINIGDLVSVVNSTNGDENGIYSYEGSEEGWQFQGGINVAIKQETGQSANDVMSQKAVTTELDSVRSDLKEFDNNFYYQSVLSNIGVGGGFTLSPSYTFLYITPIQLADKGIISINVKYKIAGVGGILIFKKNSDSEFQIIDRYTQDVAIGVNTFKINKAYSSDVYFGVMGGLTATVSTTNVSDIVSYLFNPNPNNDIGSVLDLSYAESYRRSPDFEVIYADHKIDLNALEDEFNVLEDALEDSKVLIDNTSNDLYSEYEVLEQIISSWDWINVENKSIQTYTNYLMTQEQTSPVDGIISKMRIYSEQTTISSFKVAITQKINDVITTISEYLPTGYDYTYNQTLKYFEITGLNIPIQKGQVPAIYIPGVSYFNAGSGLTTKGAYWNGTTWAISSSNKGVLMDYYVSEWIGIKDLIYKMKLKLDLISLPTKEKKLKYKKTHSISFDTSSYWSLSGWTINGNTATTTGNEVMLCNTAFRSDKRLMRSKLIFSNDSIVLVGGCWNTSVPESSFVIDVPSKKLKIHQREYFYDLTKIRKEIDIPFDIVVGREYFVEVNRIYKTNSIRLSDSITGETVYLEDNWSDTTYTLGSGNIRPKYFFKLQSGSNVSVVDGIEISLVDSPFIVFGGDSNTESNGRVTGYDWAENLLINTFNSDGTIVAQTGLNTGELILSLQNEVLEIKPRYFVCMIGTNGGGTQAQYDQIVSICNDNNIELILCHIPCSNRDYLTPNGYIKNTGVQTVRHDIATALNNNPLDGANPALFKGDLVHMNQKGHDAMAKRFLIDMYNLRYD